MLKRLASYLLLFTFLVSCKVYRPYEVEYANIDTAEKEYYLKFDNAPQVIYRLNDVEKSDINIKGVVHSNFEDINTKNAVELWMVEGYQYNLSNGKEINIKPGDILRIEEYKYSSKASIMQNTGIVFGAALVGAIIYVSSNQ